MARAIAAALALVLMVPGGATAQPPSPEASPEATPPYAPDDLAFTLPTQVGPVTLVIESTDGTEALARAPEQREKWRGLLLPFGRQPDDILAARAYGTSEQGDAVVSLTAVRLEGVPADDLRAPLVLITADIDLVDPPPDMSLEWLDVDGRRVKYLTEDTDRYFAFYSKGEVLFMLDGLGVTIEEILAELP